MRCASGIWPPSKPTRKPSLLAFWPFWPRPDVLPRPEPVPRPIRWRRLRDPAGGVSSCSRIALVTPLVLLVRPLAPDLVFAALRPHVGRAFHGDEEVDGLEHAAHRVVVRQLARLIQPAEPERLNGRADRRLRADHALHERGSDGFGGFDVPTRPASRVDLPASGEGFGGFDVPTRPASRVD